MSNIGREYNIWVVQAWDEASWNFKAACDKANAQITIADLFENTWRWYRVNWFKWVVETIDWVWTKIQIYERIFDSLISDFESWMITEQDLFQSSVDIWERMLHDLIAMNVDDLRDGEMAVAATNIIDINHLRWVRWKVFSDSMAKAMWNVIRELDIAMTAWETAILWEPRKVWEVVRVFDDTSDRVLALIEWLPEDVRRLRAIQKLIENVNDIVSQGRKKIEIIMKSISFNIWWTWLWLVWKWNKLVELQEWQRIIYIQEKPDQNWIIWPRSNWITAIRNYMTELVWADWEMLSFEQFLEIVWEEKTSKLPKRLIDECSWLKMWQIATWKTTVFNPFVSRELLWWLNNHADFDISSIIHVTWNPARKIKEWLRWQEDLSIEIDLEWVKLPQITELLQRLCYIDDKDAIKSWNMWIPYVLVCTEEYSQDVINVAEQNWYIARDFWKIVSWWQSKLLNVWVWKSNIEL